MTDAALWRKIDQLSTALERLRARVPLRQVPGGAPGSSFVVIMGGNALDPGGVDGIVYAPAAPASIPLYDPTTLPSTVDGVGVGYEPSTGSYLLIANYLGAAVYSQDLFEGQLVVLGATVTLPITSGGGTTSTLYVPVGIG